MAKALSFPGLVSATARQKAEAARARSAGSAAEKPKEVILSACEAIAADLKADGFSFAKSGPKLKRVQGDLTFTVAFQSDRNNIAGKRAAVWIHAGVTSEKLAKARRSHPMPWGGDDGPGAGAVTGGQIGNLLAEPTWMEWDFAQQDTRQSEIDDAIGAVRRIILPFFALFDDPASAVELLIHRPALWPTSLVQYANVAVSREAAEAAGNAFLKCNPPIRERFDEALAKFKRSGLPAYHTDIGSDLAAIAVANSLDFIRRE
jgi:hypothetical protein